MLATSAPFSKWFASCLNPPAITLPSPSFSLSLPYSINHQNPKLYVFGKKGHLFAVSLQNSIRKTIKWFKDLLQIQTPIKGQLCSIPPGLSPLCTDHGDLAGWTSLLNVGHVKHFINWSDWLTSKMVSLVSSVNPKMTLVPAPTCKCVGVT